MITPRVSWRSRCGYVVLMTLVLAGTIGLQPWTARGQDPPPNPTPVADGADPQGRAGAGR